MIATEPWKGFLPPFRLWGNCCFVGSMPASVHIVETETGLIMFDCGYQESLYLVLEHMRCLGLDPARITDLFITHGHIDHCAAAEAIRRLTGCRIFLGEADAPAVQGTADTDLTYAGEFGMSFIYFTPDILLRDGDEVTIGGTTIRAIATPGHTAGTMSYRFNLHSGDRTLYALLHGGAGMNTLTQDYLDRHHLPTDLRDAFRASMKKMGEISADIFLGNHADQNDTPSKAQRIAEGDLDAFVDPTALTSYANRCLVRLNKRFPNTLSSD